MKTYPFSGERKKKKQEILLIELVIITAVAITQPGLFWEIATYVLFGFLIVNDLWQLLKGKYLQVDETGLTIVKTVIPWKQVKSISSEKPGKITITTDNINLMKEYIILFDEGLQDEIESLLKSYI